MDTAMHGQFDKYKQEQKNLPDTKTTSEDGYLTGKLLISMPSLNGSYFEKSVIYLCGHDKNGALGIVINQPMSTISFEDILKQVDIPLSSKTPELPEVLTGGPVENVRGFILHTLDLQQEDTLIIQDKLGLTNSVAMLRLIANGADPQEFLFALGYAGWGKGQLEDEIKSDAWLVTDATNELIFKIPNNEVWDKSLESLGVTPLHLSLLHGQA